MENMDSSKRRLASSLWLIYTLATIVGSLVVLAMYVSAYDNTGVTERLQAMGAFTRTAMQLLSFPLGFPLGAAADPFLERRFGCAASDEPCATFIDWWTHFAAILVQIVIFHRLIRRLRPANSLN
jgi:magnesium-transporting ATPase (P-type)